jgi:hypothetical protein
MLTLDDPRWSELGHAYGLASDTPDLLRQLEAFPKAEGRDEPWFSLWSSLAHQGDVYPASFAAVPHVIRILAKAPETIDYVYFQFPAWIEICRQQKKVPIPDDLKVPYFSALGQLPSLVAAAATREWDEELLGCALSAIAAAKGYGTVAEAVMELSPAIADDFLKWFHEL